MIINLTIYQWYRESHTGAGSAITPDLTKSEKSEHLAPKLLFNMSKKEPMALAPHMIAATVEKESTALPN